MNDAPKILAFAGSARKDSWNKKLVHIAAHGARAAGADVTLIDLRDFPMPLYDGDEESENGIPDNALRLRELMLSHQGLLLASPEYNGSISPLLKNTIDWTTRQVDGSPGLAPYTGKVAALLAASPGGFGGLRGLVHVRAILGNVGVLVMPEQLAVGVAHEAFGADGAMANPKQQHAVEELGANLAKLLAKLHGLSLAPESTERRHDLTRLR
ncbi:NADPH-dependent FMN reductase [Pseudogulbenkiania sp. NH8B]|uniref:NADPH-dependent FMN reductase n=1 Tax=Pseudogulbenkiania sp. (strain NH8B) TaxID=748280 RepID=UPI0002279F44|nr:NAD(P)H-dependent oxidoreductase [Pseudogulbenkiania sp. NH8B]BAK76161.1 NADPH-dependent FMN reductase [Pseudogulbenkiania sp. NH8B]